MTDTNCQPVTRANLPIIHLNGSSAENLLADWRKVYEATESLIGTLRAAYPHTRDYYVSSDPEAYAKACAAHDARLLLLDAIQTDCEAMCDHLFFNAERRK